MSTKPEKRPTHEPRPGRLRALGLATLGLAVGFWAWGLLSPLAPMYRELLTLTPFEVSVLVAVPVILGSLLRIPLGALTDRYGGRPVLAVALALTAVPVLGLTVVETYPLLLAVAFALGLGGAVFAVGIPFVNAWFPPHQRGFALGVYGVGNAGTAIAAFTAPGMVDVLGRAGGFVLVAAALLITAAAIALLGRDSPAWTPATVPFTQRLLDALKLRTAIDLAALYAITFGGFVAFGVYLPTFLQDVYALTTADAAARAGGFIVLATLARPVGGALADRFGGEQVLRVAFAVVAAGAVVAAFEPPIALATVAFLSMAAALGAGNGAVFALLGTRIPAPQVGSVTGLVGAAGGLGGFLPPIVMGLVREATGSYAIGLMLLSSVALAGLVHTWWRFVIAERLGLSETASR